MTSLIDTAASLHTKHLAYAQQALDAVPPRLKHFWLHSRICDAISSALEDLKELPEGSEKQATPAPDPAGENTDAQRHAE